MNIVMGIDPGIKSPCGIAVLMGEVPFLHTISPGKGSVLSRIAEVIEGIQDYAEVYGVTEVACERIVHYKGKGDQHGLKTLTQAIGDWCKEKRLPIAYYMAAEWQGRIGRDLALRAIIQECKIQGETTEHALCALGIAAYHATRKESVIMEVLK